MKKPFTSILNEPAPAAAQPVLPPAAAEPVPARLPPKPGKVARPPKKAARGRPVEHTGPMHAFNFKMEEEYAVIVQRAMKLEINKCNTIVRVMKDAVRLYAKQYPELLIPLPHEKNREIIE